MKLKPDEERMLSGLEGPAKQAAMQFLVQYGDALGAEELIDVDNVHSLIQFLFYPDILNEKLDINNVDEFFSKSVLNSDKTIKVDKVKAYTTTHIPAVDLNYADMLQCAKRGDPANIKDIVSATMDYSKRIGMVSLNTCTPFTAGNVPLKGQVCAWTESSAIAFANSVLGARTNIEGDHSSFAAAITGKTIKWGFILDENRLANVIVNVNVQPQTVVDWDLLGYYTGAQVGLDVPVYNNITTEADVTKLMALSASGTTSGGISMFHIVGKTPEANTLEQAIGSREVKKVIEYGEKERRETYDKLQFGANKNVDTIVVGCPHLTIQELAKIAALLEGKQTKANLFIFTHVHNKYQIEKDGMLEKIEKAGAKVIVDSCPFNVKLDPKSVVATNSTKMAHIGAGMKGWQSVWYGSTEECVDAAITGVWKGELK